MPIIPHLTPTQLSQLLDRFECVNSTLCFPCTSQYEGTLRTYAQNSTEAWDTGHANGLSKILEKETFERRKHSSLSDCYIPQFSSIAVAKFPTGLSIGMETVSQSYPAGKLQPNYYGSAVTQSL